MARLSAPALSTSETHVFDDDVDQAKTKPPGPFSEEQLRITYEIDRTLVEIKRAQYKRIALQFPDNMLCHAPRVCHALSHGCREHSLSPKDTQHPADARGLEGQMHGMSVTNDRSKTTFYILGDTSYGSCCVDEIAAEHIDADVIVHYGRACLSPTTRLPVIHIFTVQPLPDIETIWQEAERTFADRSDKIILMADLPYQCYLHNIFNMLQSHGFLNLYETEVKHDPSSLLPNRTVPDEVSRQPCRLKDWHLLHVADPPDALLLTLSSRVASIHICNIPMSVTGLEKPASLSTTRALNRRYALLTSVKTSSTFGILINTLSVQNYLDMVGHVKEQILAAGKKSYQFVVGKVNAAKLANFSEIDAWVVIGCWESSLIDSKDIWKPIITPFELRLSLQEDQDRTWTGEWSSDYQRILDMEDTAAPRDKEEADAGLAENKADESSVEADDSEPESSPPEFDLRSGRYVSGSRPMHFQPHHSQKSMADNALAKRSQSKIAIMGGQLSPGADFLRNKRGWKGLGSDFDMSSEEPNTSIAEGRSGLARAYVNDRAH